MDAFLFEKWECVDNLFPIVVYFEKYVVLALLDLRWFSPLLGHGISFLILAV